MFFRKITLFSLLTALLGFSILTQAQVQPICFYEEVEGEINNANPSQSYIFTNSGLHTVTIEMEVLSGSLDPYLEVYSESSGDRIAIATNIALGGSLKAKLFNLRLEAGDYSIIASRISGENGSTTGTYKLHVDIGGPEIMEDYEGLISGGGNLFEGDLVTGYQLDSDTSNDQNNSDLWYFSGNAGERVTIIVSSDSSITDNDNVVRVQLWDLATRYSDSEGIMAIAWDAITSATDGFQLRLDNILLPETARYLIIVTICRGSNDGGCYNDSDVDAGDQFSYELSLLGSGGERPNIPCATPVSTFDLETVPYENLGVAEDVDVLNYVSTVQGNVDDELVLNYYTFAALADDLITVTMTRTSDDLVPLLGIQDVNGELLDRETADLSGRRAVMNFLVPESGWYALIATREDVDEGTSIGNYQLQFEGSSVVGELSSAPDIGVTATVVSSGQVQEGDISDEQVTLYYLISLDRDEEVVLSMRRTTGDLEPLVAMMDTDLSVIERGRPDLAGRTSTLTFTAPSDGWYVVATTRDGADAGLSSGGFALQIGE